MLNFKLTLLLLSFLSLTSYSTSAQTSFEVPQDPQLKTKDDYVKYEPAIVDAAKWLEATDLDKETDKRKEVNAFVIKWISGTSTITIGLDQKLMKIYGENAQLLVIYMADYAREFIENKSTATKHSAMKAGLIGMMNIYQKGIAIEKCKDMEKVIRINADGKLDDYITNKL